MFHQPAFIHNSRPKVEVRAQRVFWKSIGFKLDLVEGSTPLTPLCPPVFLGI